MLPGFLIVHLIPDIIGLNCSSTTVLLRLSKCYTPKNGFYLHCCVESVKLLYASISYGAPIIYIELKEGIELGFPEINELTRAAESLSRKKPYVVLTNVPKNVNVTNEGRRASADPRTAPLHRGNAVIVENSMYQLAANFFSNFNKPIFPFKAFTDKQKAIDWLLTLPLNK